MTHDNFWMREKIDEWNYKCNLAYFFDDAEHKYKTKIIDGWSLNEIYRSFAEVFDLLVKEKGKQI